VGSKTVAHFINLGMTAVFKKVAKNAVSWSEITNLSHNSLQQIYF
jgi:hypothetical protein